MVKQVPYTCIPNWVLEDLDRPQAQTKILLHIARQTIGYRRKEFRLSHRQIQRATGLGSRAEQEAVATLIENGLIVRRLASPKRALYRLRNVPSLSTKDVPNRRTSETEDVPTGTTPDVPTTGTSDVRSVGTQLQRNTTKKVLPSSDELPSPAEMVLYPPNGPALRKAESNGNLVTKLDTIWRERYEQATGDTYPHAIPRTRKHWKQFLAGQKRAINPDYVDQAIKRYADLIRESPESAQWWGNCQFTVEKFLEKLPMLQRWMPDGARLYVA